MPSVLFISLMAGSSWGGSEELWYKTALYAQNHGWKVGCAVYYWQEKEKKIQPLKNGGAEVYYFPNKGRAKRNLLQRIQNKISKQRIKKVLQKLPVKDYDIVIVNMGAFENTTPAWRGFYKNLNHFIILYHNYKEHEVLKGAKKRAVQNWMNHAHLNLFASRRIMEILENNSGIKITNAGILLNPISFPVPHNSTPYPQLKEGNYQFVMLAALETWRKAQDNLIIALSSKKWKQRHWNLHLYGDGKDKVRLKEIIKENELTEKIFVHGHTNEIKTVLENAHLVVQMTHIDAMPLAVVEAMAIGRPVAVSKIGDMPYWINEEENGWISSDASVKQIEVTLEKAWQQKEQWAQMGENGFSIFKTKFPSSAEENLLEKIEAVRRI